LDSAYAEKHLEDSNGRHIKYDSVIYQDGDIFLIKSDAVFQIITDFGRFWKVLLVLKMLPKSWTDSLYDLIARNRYQWFGKKDSCMVPTKEISSRFLS